MSHTRAKTQPVVAQPLPPTARRSVRRERAGRPGRRRGNAVLLPQLLAAAVEFDHAKPALSCDGLVVTYGELDARSSQLARALIARGIGPEDLVAIALHRSVEWVVAVWAVAKTGAGYLPVDPRYPSDRVVHMLDDSRASFGLTTSAGCATLPAAVEWFQIDEQDRTSTFGTRPISYAERVRPLQPEHPAYVIYTSGSTGTPKGVVVTHAGLANLCVAEREQFGVDPSARTLHFASPSFDASMLEMLLAVGAGATMVLAPADLYGGPQLSELLAREHVSHAFLTPAVLASLDPTGLDSLRVVVVGGEACPPELVARWATHGRAVHNASGPTEATVATNISDALRGEVTLGNPVPGVAEYILDARLRPVAKGVAGELYISGPALARGYVERAALTAERFVADPFATPPTRMYRTGDLVRRVGPRLEYLGRNDSQVNIRGLRVELGEIDAVLTAAPGVRLAVTTVHTTPAQGTVLVTYVEADGAGIDLASVRAVATARLPRHMVPADVVVVDRLPLTPAGKIDRANLPEPAFRPAHFVEPATTTERVVADVFAEVLRLERVGAHDDFLALGGDSIVATRTAARLGRELGRPIPVQWLFTDPTPARIAERLTVPGVDGGAALAVLLPIRPADSATTVFCIHAALGLAWSFAGLTHHLPPQVGLYGLQSPVLSGGDTPTSIDTWAKQYVEEILAVQREGPYHVLGWSLGGVIAHAVATQLQALGHEVALLALLDSSLDTTPRPGSKVTVGDFFASVGSGAVAEAHRDLESLTLPDYARLVSHVVGDVDLDWVRRQLDSAGSVMDLVLSYQPETFVGDMVFFAAAAGEPAESAGWRTAVAGRIIDHAVPVSHWQMTSAQALAQIGAVVTEFLHERRSTTGPTSAIAKATSNPILTTSRPM